MKHSAPETGVQTAGSASVPVCPVEYLPLAGCSQVKGGAWGHYHAQCLDMPAQRQVHRGGRAPEVLSLLVPPSGHPAAAPFQGRWLLSSPFLGKVKRAVSPLVISTGLSSPQAGDQVLQQAVKATYQGVNRLERSVPLRLQ